MMDGDISPPPLKRRKIEASSIAVEHEHDKGSEARLQPRDMGVPTGRSIRLFSWNINGIQPFLPESNAAITSFFKPVSQKDPTSRRGPPRQQGVEPQSNHMESSLRRFLQRHHWPEVLFLQELKISPFDKKTPNALLGAINTAVGNGDNDTRSDQRYTLDTNLPRDKHNARGFGGKLYGVGTLLREDFASQNVADVRHADWDLEGRVTIVELRSGQMDLSLGDTQPQTNAKQPKRVDARPLALLNVYAVNGTTAPYRSPDSGKVVGTRHDHKLAFHTRLRDECLELESRGFSVVIAGDLNIARGRLDGHPNLRTYPRQHRVNRADFNTKFFGDEDNARAEAYTGELDTGTLKELDARFDGVDVFRALRGKERRYTYHPRSGDDWGSSCDRVDFIIVSRALFDSRRIADPDILDSPEERGTSDHVPLRVNIKLGENLAAKEDENFPL